HDRAHRLGGGPHVGERVLLPRTSLGVGLTGPEVDDVLAVPGDADARAHLEAVVEVAGELVAYSCEGIVAMPVDLGHLAPFRPPSPLDRRADDDTGPGTGRPAGRLGRVKPAAAG